MDTLSKVYVGVDVSKAYVDVYIHPCGKALRVVNTERGLEYLLKVLCRFDVQMVGCEVTGGYQDLLISTVKKSGYNAWEIDPVRIKAFIKSENIKIKTDKNDAKMIALFCSQKSKPYERLEPSESVKKLKPLVNRRVQVITMLADEKKRLQQYRNEDTAIKLIKEHMQYLEKMIQSIDQRITEIIKCDPDLCKKFNILMSVPGIGQVTTSAIIAEMPECGMLDGKQIAALAGVAPYTNESGIYVGRASIQGGRDLPRRALYMAALSAARCNARLREFYQRLVAKGKPAKVALVAVMRKLIIILNAMLRKQESWKENIGMY